MYKTCAIYRQVSKQASIARILFAGFFVIFSTSTNKIFLDARISENTKKLSTTPNLYDTSQDNKNMITTAPQLQSFQNHHSLSLVPQNYRHTPITEHTSSRHSYL